MVTIAPLQSPAEYKLCEALQQEIWQADPVEIVPADLMIITQRHGGLVLGAFDENRNLVGCLYGFAGTTASDNPLAKKHKWQHCSHIMGVHNSWRGKGIGHQLKIAQRNWALKEGYEIVTWTFNPLEGANATLNIAKLGARCACYLRNIYGELPDGLNSGLLSDRFEVVWELRSERVNVRLNNGRETKGIRAAYNTDISVLNAGRFNYDGWLEPTNPIEVTEQKVLIEFPVNFQELKSHSLDLAISWQLNLRQACEWAFRSGYVVCDVIRITDNSNSVRAYYVLESSLA